MNGKQMRLLPAIRQEVAKTSNYPNKLMLRMKSALMASAMRLASTKALSVFVYCC